MSPNSKSQTLTQATDPTSIQLDHIEDEVRDRYAKGADAVEPALCCPIDGYEAKYLEALPSEIIEKDYGCGDPSKWALPGDRVVDLGSGAGKVCYILSQKVGAKGSVTGVDFNNAMLDLSRKYQDSLAQTFGYANTQFVKAKIQDLALNLDKLQSWLESNPINSVESIAAYEAECDRLRNDEPLIASNSTDLVVSNCVLNLVRPEDKVQLFADIFRVLEDGGRAVISDIVCDETPTEKIMADPKLWSGCISGAFLENEFLEMFEEAGFHGIEILARSETPWQVIDGVEFRSMTVRAYKGKQGPCLDRHQAVVYKGPWKAVLDDDGHEYARGERMAVCEKTYKLLTDTTGPYAAQTIGIEPYAAVPLNEAIDMNCRADDIRDPKLSKGGGDINNQQTSESSCCSTDSSSCC